ncbi:hypothetical protein CEXT_711011 [Caerostris extrusa]|uniref:Uncharacterized protein n=1 Tax=Caerostris extrusa TaxID=172846 RepID=A0AAV4TMB6_CAEEX|nr:hypothetical protein CEXT_711011 [Caerostris extrusa]
MSSTFIKSALYQHPLLSPPPVAVTVSPEVRKPRALLATFLTILGGLLAIWLELWSLVPQASGSYPGFGLIRTNSQTCLPLSSNPLRISIIFHPPPVAVTASPETSKTSQAVNGKQKLRN